MSNRLATALETLQASLIVLEWTVGVVHCLFAFSSVQNACYWPILLVYSDSSSTAWLYVKNCINVSLQLRMDSQHLCYWYDRTCYLIAPSRNQSRHHRKYCLLAFDYCGLVTDHFHYHCDSVKRDLQGILLRLATDGSCKKQVGLSKTVNDGVVVQTSFIDFLERSYCWQQLGLVVSWLLIHSVPSHSIQS